MSGTSEAELRAEAFWVKELDQLVGCALHDLRNVMQAAGINIQVLHSRTRGDQPGVAVRDLRSFADAASRQFDLLTERVEALSALCRQGTGAPDLNSILQGVELLLRTNRKGSIIVYQAEAPVPVQVSHSAARALLVHVVMTHLAEGDSVVCRVIDREPFSVEFSWQVERDGGIEPEMTRVASDLLVGVRRAERAITLIFPTRLRSDTVLT